MNIVTTLLITQVVELLIVLPLTLYLTGKILKITSERFRFFECLWMLIISGLLAGFLSEIHPLLGLLAFVALLLYLIKKQFKATTAQSIITVLVLGITLVALEFANNYIESNFIYNNTDNDIVDSETTEETKETEEKVSTPSITPIKESDNDTEWDADIDRTDLLSGEKKIFTNSEHGISFEYPAEWILVSTDPGGIILKNREFTSVYMGDMDLAISLHIYLTNLSLSEWFEEFDEFSEGKLKKIIDFMNEENGGNFISRDDIRTKTNYFDDPINQIENKYDKITQEVIFDKPGYIEGPAYSYKTVVTKIGDKIFKLEAKSPTGPTIAHSNLMNHFGYMIPTLKFEVE